MSEPTPSEGGAATLSEYRRREQSITLSPVEEQIAQVGAEETHDELLTLNFGPHHPATHGVLRLLVTLQGEIVRDLKPIVGYVHTGIEKTAEDKSYWKVIPVIERMDYLAYYFNAMAYCSAVEVLAEVEVPAQGPVPARHPPRAEPHRLAPDLARNERARPRRGLDLPLLPARAGADPRPVRDVLRSAHAHALLPGRRGLRGHPAGVRAQAARVPARDARAGRRIRRHPQLQRDRAAAAARHLPAGRRDAAVAGSDRAAAARRRPPVGPAQGRPLLLLRGLRLQDPGRHRRRQLRPLRGPPGRDLRVGEDHRAGASTGCPKDPSSPPTARWHCRRATSSPPRWRR